MSDNNVAEIVAGFSSGARFARAHASGLRFWLGRQHCCTAFVELSRRMVERIGGMAAWRQVPRAWRRCLLAVLRRENAKQRGLFVGVMACADVDSLVRKARAGWLPRRRAAVPWCRLAICSAVYTHASVANCEAESHDWETSEDGELIQPDQWDIEERGDGVSALVSLLVKRIVSYGAIEPSCSEFHPGVWYTATEGGTDYRTGDRTEYTFHLRDCDELVERLVYDAIRRY